MKKILFMLLALVLAFSAGLAGCVPAEEEEEPPPPAPITLKVAATIPAPPYSVSKTLQDYLYSVAANWSAIKAPTDPAVNFTFYWASALLTSAEMWSGVAGGIADIGHYIAGTIPGRTPRFDIARLPFLGFSSWDEAICVWDRAYEDSWFLGEIEGGGVIKLLFPHVMPPYHLHMLPGHGPVVVPGDIVGKSIGGEGEFLQLILAAGATPVATPTAELFYNLNTGLIKGNMLHFSAQQAFGALNLTPHHTIFGEAGIAFVPMLWIMNRARWDSLPAGFRTLLMAGINATKTKMAADQKAIDAGNIARAHGWGHTFTNLTAPQIEVWVDLAKPLHAIWRGQSAAHNTTYTKITGFIAACPP